MVRMNVFRIELTPPVDIPLDPSETEDIDLDGRSYQIPGPRRGSELGRIQVAMQVEVLTGSYLSSGRNHEVVGSRSGLPKVDVHIPDDREEPSHLITIRRGSERAQV